MSSNPIALLRRIFEIAPEAKSLWKSLDGYEVGDDKMFRDEKFMKHMVGVIGTVDKAVGMLASEDMDELVTILKGLGKRHVQYGVVEAYYPVVGQALLGTLNDALGDKLTTEDKAAWAEIYGVISSTMIEGAKA